MNWNVHNFQPTPCSITCSCRSPIGFSHWSVCIRTHYAYCVKIYAKTCTRTRIQNSGTPSRELIDQPVAFTCIILFLLICFFFVWLRNLCGRFFFFVCLKWTSITSCMNLRQTGRISLLSVAENIITCFECGVLRKISWTSRRISVRRKRRMTCYSCENRSKQISIGHSMRSEF